MIGKIVACLRDDSQKKIEIYLLMNEWHKEGIPSTFCVLYYWFTGWNSHPLITHETGGFVLIPTRCFESVVVTQEDLDSGRHHSVLGSLEMLLLMTMPRALKSNLFTSSKAVPWSCSQTLKPKPRTRCPALPLAGPVVLG